MQQKIKLSDGEWILIRIILQQKKAAARDIISALPSDVTWSVTTVKTMLSRMVKKEILTFKQIGNSYQYESLYTEEQLQKEEVKSFTKRVLGGALKPFLVHFCENNEPSAEDIETMRSLIDHFDHHYGAEK